MATPIFKGVIPTFIVDPPIFVLIGLVAAYSSPRDFPQSLFKTRAFWVGVFIALGFMGISFYGYLKSPDWMFGYLLPASAVPSWIVLGLYGISLALYMSGFFLNTELKKIHALWRVLAIVLFLMLEAGVLTQDLKAYQTVATFEEFHKGLGVALPESAVGKGGTVPSILLFLLGFFLLRWAKKQKVSTL